MWGQHMLSGVKFKHAGFMKALKERIEVGMTSRGLELMNIQTLLMGPNRCLCLATCDGQSLLDFPAAAVCDGNDLSWGGLSHLVQASTRATDMATHEPSGILEETSPRRVRVCCMLKTRRKTRKTRSKLAHRMIDILNFSGGR